MFKPSSNRSGASPNKRRFLLNRSLGIFSLAAAAFFAPHVQSSPTTTAGDRTTESPDLDKINGIAGETPDGSIQLAKVFPHYEVPSNIERSVIVGTSTIEKSLEVVAGVAESTQPILNAAYEASEFIKVFHEAATVGLTAGHENIDAELYILDQRASEMRQLVEKAQRSKGDKETLKQIKSEFETLRGSLSQFKSDFGNHSSAWSFFEKAVLTEADTRTLVMEASVFAKEYFVLRFLEKFLGRAGAWLSERLGLGRASRWVWKGVKPELRSAIGEKTWKRWRIDSRLTAYRAVLKNETIAWSNDLLGEIRFPEWKTSYADRIRLISARVASQPVPDRPLKVEVVRIQTVNPVQAMAVIQNIEFAPAQLRAFQSMRVEVLVEDPGSHTSSFSTDSSQMSGSSVPEPTRTLSEQYQVRSRESTIHLNDDSAFRQAGHIRITGKGFD